MTPTPTDESAWVHSRLLELAEARSRGEPADVRSFLDAHPPVPDEAAIRLIYEHACSLRDAGETVTTVEVLRRFPRYGPQLRVLLDCDRLLRSGRVRLPEAGDRLGPFDLIAELGRGSTGRTFLASEPALGGRLVVVKVMADDQDEHLSLARLQHTHIIPLFSEHQLHDQGVRALCMPYRGGTSLDRVLQSLAEIPPSKRRGGDILDALDTLAAGLPPPPRTDGPCRRFLRNASWNQAICWIGACLADALDGAHSHRLIHMDLKPSNVLIAADGLPMLLDFHLARAPIRAGELVFDRLGGTPGWMAPEQEAGLRETRRGEPVRSTIDHRCDIHALGLLLRESLGDRGLDPSLAEIVARCTAPRADDRYSTAAEVAADLRRHLEDPSQEGVRKRKRGALRAAAWLLAFSSVLSAVAVVGFTAMSRTQEAARALERGRILRVRGDFETAAAVLGHGLSAARSLPWTARTTARLTAELERCRRDREMVRRVGEPPEADGHAGLGRMHLRAGRLAEARAEFGKVLEEHPDDFRANFEDGVCAYRLDQSADAAAAFRACLALRPESAECLYNYALALESLGREEMARKAYDRAARLDPSLASARLNRGLSLYRAGRNSEAIHDLQHAIRTTADRSILGRAHDAWALAALAEGQLDEARSHAAIAAGFGSSQAQGELRARDRRQLTQGSARSVSASRR